MKRDPPPSCQNTAMFRQHPTSDRNSTTVRPAQPSATCESLRRRCLPSRRRSPAPPAYTGTPAPAQRNCRSRCAAPAPHSCWCGTETPQNPHQGLRSHSHRQPSPSAPDTAAAPGPCRCRRHAACPYTLQSSAQARPAPFGFPPLTGYIARKPCYSRRQNGCRYNPLPPKTAETYC